MSRSNSGGACATILSVSDKARFSITRGDLLAVLGLVGLVLLLVAPALRPGRVLIPFDIVTEAWPPWQRPNQPIEVNNILLSDAVNYIVPVKRLLADSIRQGQFPLWNPFVLGGYPLTYNTQAGAFYPLTALYYFLPLLAVVDLTIILQMILGALFMYAFLRQIKLGEIAAFAGAVVFTFNGLMLIWLEWQVVHAAIVWLPLQLFLVERIRIKSAGNDPATSTSILLLSILCGLSLALPWLGGHWNWAIYNSLTLAAYLLWRIGPSLREQRTWAKRRTLVFAALLIFLIGIGLSMVQVLPAFGYLSQSHREPLSIIKMRREGLLNRFVALLIPNFFGSPVDNNWWGVENFAETTFYLGMLPLFLTAITVLTRRDRPALFFIGWGFFGLLLSLGEPAYRLLHILPVFNGFFPSRAVIVPLFSVAVLSAMGLEFLLTAPPESRRRLRWIAPVTFIMLVVLASVYFYTYRDNVSQTWEYLRRYTIQAALLLTLATVLMWLRLSDRVRAGLFAGLVLAIIIVDLFSFGRRYNTISSASDWFPDNAVTDFLMEESELSRIVTTHNGIVFPPNSSMVFGIHNISGYEPGIWQRTVDYMNAAEGENVIRASRVVMPQKGLDSNLMDVVNVKHVVTTHDLWHDEPVMDINQDHVDRWLSLLSGSKVEQHFTVAGAGLHRVDLMLKTPEQIEGTVTARVLTADGVLPLAHHELNVTDIEREGWQSFFFAPFSTEWGRTFLLQVEYSGDGELLLGASSEDLLADSELSAGGITGGDLALVSYYYPRPNLVFEDGKARIYLNEGYFERAFFVPQAIIAETPAGALEAVVAHQSELDEIVILELVNQAPPPDFGAGTAASSNIEIMEYDLNRVELQASTDLAGFLVLADTYYPGWRATIDGERTPVYQADYLLRAIYLPPGDHTIEFSFLPPDFLVGLAISGLTLFACLLLTVMLLRKGRSERAG